MGSVSYYCRNQCLVTNEVINSEIQNSTGLIAIATPRILDENTHTYKTLEWLHSETGLAYAQHKP
jgi:hypothetical protein